MALIVKKFGGTSLENIEKIKSAAEKVAKSIRNGDKVVVVVSAMAGSTNQLVSYCSAISKLSSVSASQEYDVALSSGEIVTAALFALALQEMGLKSRSCQGWQIPIRATNSHSKALIEDVDREFLDAILANGEIPVVCGFQGVSYGGNKITSRTQCRVVTLGRGGSDTTAAAVAAAVSADICEIYTDVDGVYSADPRMVNSAKKIEVLSYAEMLSFASSGAKVLHPRAVQIVMRYNIPLKVLSSFRENAGTLITDKEKIMEYPKITGIAYNNNLGLIRVIEIKEPLDLVSNLCKKDISVENILLSENSVSFTVPLLEIERLKEILSGDQLDINTNIALVSVIGHAINQEVLVSVLTCVDAEEIMSLFTSEVKVSFIVDIKSVEMVVKRLHDSLVV